MTHPRYTNVLFIIFYFFPPLIGVTSPPFAGFSIFNKYFIAYKITINNNDPNNSFTNGLFSQSLNDTVSPPISVTISTVSSDEPTG